MKLELKKTTNPDGNIFYSVWKDNMIERSFWVGNSLTGEDGMGAAKAFNAAKDLFERLKDNKETIIEVIQSTEI